MDADTKKKLEDIQSLTPRYLFRAWNNTPVETQTPGRLSGGHKNLNRPDAIVPLAFKNNNGRASVYDLTKSEFTDMAIAHLTGQFSPETELSSWASSLAFALNNVAWMQLGGEYSEEALDNVHVSVIDSKALDEKNRVFYVPRLDFLSPGQFSFPHEYLAHGVISGAAHKALPLRVFHKVLKLGSSGPPMSVDDERKALKVTEQNITKAREIGDQYGGAFALPVALAVLCRKKRESKLWRDGVQESELNLISSRVLDLEIPREWASDRANQDDAEFAPSYGDVEQFCRLMRALGERANESGQRKLSNVGGEMRLSSRTTRRSKQIENSNNDNGKQNSDSSKYANAAQERAAKRVKAKRRSDRIAELQTKQRLSDENMSEEEEKTMKRMQRALKKLKIDMKKL